MTRVKYINCGKKDVIVRKVSEWEKRKILYLEYRVGRKREWQNWREAAYSMKGKVQQDNVQTEAPKGTAKERGKQREVKRTFKMLREVWLDIGVEKIDMHKGITVKTLLDSGAIRMFID